MNIFHRSRLVLRSLSRYSHDQAADTIFADSRRPELFYHLVQPPTPLSPDLSVFAISFLNQPLHNAESSAVLGWVPVPHEAGSVTPEEIAQRVVWRDFRENASFKDILHKSLYTSLRDGKDEIWVNGAKQLQQGWMHIHDQRNPPALGRVGDPDDIIASVLVENSTVKPETYQPMPSYRVCTADGVLQLTPAMLEDLVTALQRVVEGENANVNP
ncbi:hypothetical protein DFP72DRAFT_1015767 [Ephemerocybe angulata]|uniref:Uncharacterized protein n=1 Tax=Ephemerocybe angulata TaxID=980116 RepID=A0A8H6HJT6_9AGAR|nr:hypothetical protein DFP72DRAFT_1015767 [Tulosesus angulatus]